MANTVYGPFNAINVVNGTTAANATWGNNVQTQASVALNGLNGDFWSSHVLSGVTPTIDGTLANQLDIASGVVYLRMTDNSIARCTVVATNFSTATPSTTYYLDLNPDGSWSWGTAHSGVANHFPIAQCTTDGSGNIATLTDNRGPSGQPGVPITVARTMLLAITDTADHNVLDYLPTVAGYYRFNLYFSYRNATPQKVITSARWHDVTLATTGQAFFTLTNTSAVGQSLNGSQATTTGNNQSCTCASIVVYANPAGPTNSLNIHFQDPGGTPNDVISCSIERIA